MTWSVLTIHVFSERSCRFKKEFWAKIRGMSSQKGGSVEELKKLGWGAALAFFDGLPMEEVKKRLEATCESWGLEEFEELRQEAKKQKVALDREENLVMQNPSGLKDVTWVPQTGHAVHRGRAPALEMARARTLMPRMSWPTRYQRRMHHAQEDAQREKIEEEERDRQIRKLMELLSAAELIDGEDKRGEEASVWMVRPRAMGRRANTLRAHVRMGQRMQEFTSAALGRSWFEGPGDVMDYIAGRVEEPCGKSVPASVYSALKFLEMSAEVPREKRISEDETLRNFMAEISKSHWWVSREKASAHRLVLAVVMCLHFLLMIDEESLYIRLYAWFKLVKLWGMLRWSDTLGIPASRVRFHRKEGLVGEIVRSKTTGVGRRVEVQTFYISDKAWLLSETWLEEGYRIFERFGVEARNEKRDFLMARPNKGLDDGLLLWRDEHEPCHPSWAEGTDEIRRRHGVSHRWRRGGGLLVGALRESDNGLLGRRPEDPTRGDQALGQVGPKRGWRVREDHQEDGDGGSRASRWKDQDVRASRRHLRWGRSYEEPGAEAEREGSSRGEDLPADEEAQVSAEDPARGDGRSLGISRFQDRRRGWDRSNISRWFNHGGAGFGRPGGRYPG